MSVLNAVRPETVCAYFTDPARYVQWMGREATPISSMLRLFRSSTGPP